MVPNGWKLRTLGAVLEKVSDPVQVDPACQYQEIGIRSHGKGIFYKEPALGSTIGDKRVFWVKPNVFIVNIVFAWEQAVARTTSRDLGLIASHRFPMYRPKNGLCDIDYLMHFFRTKKGKALLELASPGGAGRNKTLGQKEFFDISIPLPSTPVQTKIAKIISTWDMAIAAVEKLIENSRTQKKALMQQLLTGRHRLPGFNDEWQTAQLSELVDVTMGSSPPSESYNEKQFGMPLIQGNADIKNGKSAPRIYTSEVTKTCKPGDVLLSVRAPVGTVAKSVHKACIGRGVASLSSKDTSSIDFFYHFLIFIEPTWKRLSQGSTFEAINGDDIKELTVNVPASNKEQKIIAGILDAQDAQIANLMGQATYLKNEKNALMQQLLTGNRRVKVDEKPQNLQYLKVQP